MFGVLVASCPAIADSKVTVIDILNTPIVSGTVGTILGIVLTVVLTNVLYRTQLIKAKSLENISEISRNLFARIVEIRSYLDRFNTTYAMPDEEENTAATLVYQFKQYYLSNQLLMVDKRIEEIVKTLTNKYFQVLGLFRGVFWERTGDENHPYVVKQREDRLEKASGILNGEITQLEEELKGLLRVALGVKAKEK